MLFIIPAAVVLTYAFFQSVHVYFLVRTSRQLVQQSRVYERFVSADAPRILIIGDSTGVGTGVSDPQFSIAGRFGTEFPDTSIQNISKNGWKVDDALQNFPNVPQKSMSIILLQIGANDIIRGTPMVQFSASLDAVFKKSTAAAKQVFALHSGNVGLAPFFPWPLSSIMRARTLRYREEYRRIAAANGVNYVDLYHEAADDPFQGKHEFYAADLLHLSAQGYEEWYRSIRQMMK